MKRSTDDIEGTAKAKEPRLEVDESGECSSSAAEGSEGCVKSISSSAVKEALRRSLNFRKERKLLQEELEESSLKESCESDERLQEWSRVLTSAGFFCEVRSLVSDLSPFPESLVEEGPVAHQRRFALLIFHSKHLMFDSSTGPFQAVRLIFFSDGEWRLDSSIYEHRIIARGTFNLPESKALPEEITELAKQYLTDQHVLCPGLVGVDDIESELGYTPKTVRLINGPVTTVHSKTCKIWHIPAKNVKSKRDESNCRHHRMCGECLIGTRYVSKALQKKRELGSSKRYERQKPSSNYPVKFLSPKSKSARYANSRLQRHRLEKHVKKLYKRTKVELPQDQSAELCKLVKSIEDSDVGRKELAKIYNEGNQFSSSKGQKAGDCLKEVWKKDRESFFRDQRSNGTYVR